MNVVVWASGQLPRLILRSRVFPLAAMVHGALVTVQHRVHPSAVTATAVRPGLAVNPTSHNAEAPAPRGGATGGNTVARKSRAWRRRAPIRNTISHDGHGYPAVRTATSAERLHRRYPELDDPLTECAVIVATCGDRPRYRWRRGFRGFSGIGGKRRRLTPSGEEGAGVSIIGSAPRLCLNLDTLELHDRGPNSPCAVRRITASRREKDSWAWVAGARSISSRCPGERAPGSRARGRIVSRKRRLACHVY
jgi:hypothetical protein